MKKIVFLVMALFLCFGLDSCGPDRQPAIDAFNQAKDAFNDVAAIINADMEAFDRELIDEMVETSDILEQHRQRLEGDEALTREELNEMLRWYVEVEARMNSLKAEIER